MLEACGLSEVRVVTEHALKRFVSGKLGATGDMSRTAFLAREPA